MVAAEPPMRLRVTAGVGSQLLLDCAPLYCRRASPLAHAARGPARHGANERARAKSLNAAGYLAQAEHDYPAACALFEEALALGRELQDAWNITWSLQDLAGILIVQG